MSNAGGIEPKKRSAAWKKTPTEYLESIEPSFQSGFDRTSKYVPVRDGTLLAVDVYLPIRPINHSSVPAVVVFTPYYRRFEIAKASIGCVEDAPDISELRSVLLPHGYALVVVDIRGTGASFGSRKGFRSPLERMDYYDVADWISMQSWCDGNIGSTGISYMGAAADFLASTNHPAVKAIIPSFAVWDTYKDMFYPGGLLCRTIPDAYGRVMRALDQDDRDAVRNISFFAEPAFDGPAKVDEDLSGTLLRRAIDEHAANFDMMEFVNQRQCRDSGSLGEPLLTCETISPSTYMLSMSVPVPTYAVSGWVDGYGYSDAAIRRYLSLRHKGNRLLLGPWDHGAYTHVGTSRNIEQPRVELLAEYLRFFDRHLKGVSNELDMEAPVHYFTMIAEKWQASEEWPIPGEVGTCLFLVDQARLSDTKADLASTAIYDVDFGCSSGSDTRYEPIGLQRVEQYYESWEGRDDRMLVYTSKPTHSDIEITGHPEAVLWLSSTASDGAIFVYLEDVDTEGRTHYVTEGVLRVIHRRYSMDSPTHDKTVGPYHSFRSADVEPLIPGKVIELRIGLMPVSWLLRAGHRVRVAIAGADVGHFSNVPVGETPTLTVHHGAAWPSRIVLPLIRPPASPFSNPPE